MGWGPGPEATLGWGLCLGDAVSATKGPQGPHLGLEKGLQGGTCLERNQNRGLGLAGLAGGAENARLVTLQTLPPQAGTHGTVPSRPVLYPFPHRLAQGPTQGLS